MTDFLLLEELLKLCSSMAKPRVLHKKGVGLYGKFQPYMSLSDYTTADFLKNAEEITPVFVRFSKAFGRDGGPDTARDTVGFATKFYTQEGVFDLICHNMPVYYIKEGKDFPALLSALGPSADKNLSDGKRFWSFVAEHPEAIHMAVLLHSDRGTIKSYRHVEGFSINTLEFANRSGERFLVRMKWEPMAGVSCITRQEAEFLAGFDPEIASEDLYNAVENGDYPAFELAAQILPTAARDSFGFDLTDPTLLWPESKIPYLKLGKMVLDRIPACFETEVEQAAFSPVPRIQGVSLCESGIAQAMVLAHCAGAGSRGGKVR